MLTLAPGAYFELLVNVYKPDSAGKSPVEWKKDDWQFVQVLQNLRVRGFNIGCSGCHRSMTCGKVAER
jgi:hypothetical protein